MSTEFDDKKKWRLVQVTHNFGGAVDGQICIPFTQKTYHMTPEYREQIQNENTETDQKQNPR